MTKSNTILIAVFVCMVIGAILSSRFLLKVKTPAVQTDFERVFGMAMQDYDGNTVHLYDYRRKVLVAYTWASWCTYCGQELQNLGQLKDKYGDAVQIIAINRAEPKPTAKGFTDGLTGVGNITFLLDATDAFFKAIDGYAMPETVFINAKGDIVFHQRGPLKFDEAAERMQQLLQ